MIIARITKNSLIIQLNYIVRDILRETNKNLTEVVGCENGLKYHRLIIEVFKKRDEKEVKDVMREHLLQALIDYK